MHDFKMEEKPSFSLQKDWNDIFGKSDEHIWISYKQPGSNTIHGLLQNPELNESNEDDIFKIKSFEKNELEVECCGSGCVFVAPEITYNLHKKKILCTDISLSDGLGVSSSQGGDLWIWDTDTGETRRVLSGHIADVDTCRFFPSGVVVLSGGEDFRLRIWSAQDGSCARTLTGHTRRITDTSIIEKGRNIISVSCDGTARLWDCGSGQCITSITSIQCPINKCSLFTNNNISNTQIQPPLHEREYETDNKLLLLACEDGTIKTCDVRNRKLVTDYQGEWGPITCCTFTGEGKAVVGSENGLMVFDLRVPNKPIWSVSWSTSHIISLNSLNSYCVAGHKDGSCVMFDSENKDTVIRRLTGPDIDPITSIICHDKYIYTSCRDGCVRIYKTAINST